MDFLYIKLYCVDEQYYILYNIVEAEVQKMKITINADLLDGLVLALLSRQDYYRLCLNPRYASSDFNL